jgi:hypothetical protein
VSFALWVAYGMARGGLPLIVPNTVALFIGGVDDHRRGATPPLNRTIASSAM